MYKGDIRIDILSLILFSLTTAALRTSAVLDLYSSDSSLKLGKNPNPKDWREDSHCMHQVLAI